VNFLSVSNVSEDHFSARHIKNLDFMLCLLILVGVDAYEARREANIIAIP
jgi:hypothetical protein